jgi:hypothetical protein
MDMLYELWDTVTANLTGEYPTEEDALAALYRTVEKAGPDALAGYALMRDDGVHDPVLIAADTALADLALRQHAPALTR